MTIQWVEKKLKDRIQKLYWSLFSYNYQCRSYKEPHCQHLLKIHILGLGWQLCGLVDDLALPEFGYLAWSGGDH